LENQKNSPEAADSHRIEKFRTSRFTGSGELCFEVFGIFYNNQHGRSIHWPKEMSSPPPIKSWPTIRIWAPQEFSVLLYSLINLKGSANSAGGAERPCTEINAK